MPVKGGDFELEKRLGWSTGNPWIASPTPIHRAAPPLARLYAWQKWPESRFSLKPGHWTANDCSWLVRPKSRALGQTWPVSDVADKRRLGLDVERAVRELNRRNWQLSDAISLALDDKGRPFILDLSNARHVNAKSA
ncbi:MAG: hypothetical protein GY803_22950 [Chloroflexi bacterium]|nr:hypothetical protein [Chloroflexota bacterium]